MQETTPIVGAAERLAPIEKYNDEQVRQLVIALEEPFDAREIKWRVTNTTADRRRGQVIAYADPRAYTDRLNALFTVRGWTRGTPFKSSRTSSGRSAGMATPSSRARSW